MQGPQKPQMREQVNPPLRIENLSNSLIGTRAGSDAHTHVIAHARAATGKVLTDRSNTDKRSSARGTPSFGKLRPNRHNDLVLNNARKLALPPAESPYREGPSAGGRNHSDYVAVREYSCNKDATVFRTCRQARFARLAARERHSVLRTLVDRALRSLWGNREQISPALGLQRA